MRIRRSYHEDTLERSLLSWRTEIKFSETKLSSCAGLPLQETAAAAEPAHTFFFNQKIKDRCPKAWERSTKGWQISLEAGLHSPWRLGTQSWDKGEAGYLA